jgi:hypothetical protein
MTDFPLNETSLASVREKNVLRRRQEIRTARHRGSVSSLSHQNWSGYNNANEERRIAFSAGVKP